jgi:Lon protease-like protein
VRAEMRDSQLDIPFMISPLLVPGQRSTVKFIPGSLKLMLRLCLEGKKPWFGIVIPTTADMRDNAFNYGTMFQIESVRFCPSDGSPLVDGIGAYRFRIVDRGSLDGYIVSQIVKCVLLLYSADISCSTSIVLWLTVPVDALGLRITPMPW